MTLRCFVFLVAIMTNKLGNNACLNTRQKGTAKFQLCLFLFFNFSNQRIPSDYLRHLLKRFFNLYFVDYCISYHPRSYCRCHGPSHGCIVNTFGTVVFCIISTFKRPISITSTSSLPLFPLLPLRHYLADILAEKHIRHFAPISPAHCRPNPCPHRLNGRPTPPSGQRLLGRN